jgi:hypothetical protein
VPGFGLQAPEIHGFIPDATYLRILVFAELLTLHSAHAMMRTLTLALLFRTNTRWLVAYMAADFCVFLSYKIVRGDLIYVVPGGWRCLRCPPPVP